MSLQGSTNLCSVSTGTVEPRRSRTKPAPADIVQITFLAFVAPSTPTDQASPGQGNLSGNLPWPRMEAMRNRDAAPANEWLMIRHNIQNTKEACLVARILDTCASRARR